MKPRDLSFVFLVLFARACLAADSYYVVPLSSLTFAQTPPSSFQWTNCSPDKLDFMQPYAVLEGPGEAFVTGEPIRLWDSSEFIYKNTLLAVRAPKGRPISGRLFFLKPDLSGMAPLKFTLNSSESSAANFFTAKALYYRRLRERNFPGAAWFRFQEYEAANAASSLLTNPPVASRRHFSEYNFDATFHLLNDDPTFAEHLPLEALQLPTATATIPITNLTGIARHNHDWKSLLHDPKPSLDPLSSNIPYDQHALFLPSFDALNQLLETANHDILPLLQIFQPKTSSSGARSRYETQLCLELNTLSRFVAPQLVRDIAITGSDLYLNTGTDIAVLFQTASPKTLKTLIEGAQTLAGQSHAAFTSFSGEINKVPYSAAFSEDRSISSFVGALDNLVIVSNSRAQLERLINVAQQKLPALTSQEDYVYFRQKLPANTNETAFFVLSDATIQRWCSPRWRIGHSRQLRAAAALAQLQAAHLTEFADNRVTPGPISSPELGKVFLTTNGVYSPNFGYVQSITPVHSLPLSQITPAESIAYNRWRTTFEQSFGQFFNPVAVRLSLQSQHLSAELCVSPPPTTSELRQLLPLFAGAHLTPTSADLEADLHLSFAINPESEPVKAIFNLLSGLNPGTSGNPLAWLGPSISFYADDDPLWNQLSPTADTAAFLKQNLFRLPVALSCDVKNPFSFALFILAARGVITQAAGPAARWDDLNDDGQALTRIAIPSRAEDPPGVTNFIYYAATTNALIISPNEVVLKRALDRNRSHASDSSNMPGGSNLALTLQKPFLTILENLLRTGTRATLAQVAWSNLPILNELKRSYPNHDPYKVHAKFSHSTLQCLPGDHYTWSDQFQTMESSLYGSPTQPKTGPKELFTTRRTFPAANLNLTLDSDSTTTTLVLEPTN